MREIIDEVIDYVSGSGKYKPQPKPYQRMTLQDIADLFLMAELSDRGELPSSLVPHAQKMATKWMKAAWDAIRWEARHAESKEFDPTKMPKPELSRDGLKAAIYLYDTRPFPPCYGGPKWAGIARAALRAYDAIESGAVRALLPFTVQMLFTEHNTGILGEKLLADRSYILKDLKSGRMEPKELDVEASAPVAEAAEVLPEPQFRFPDQDDTWDLPPKKMSKEPKAKVTKPAEEYSWDPDVIDSLKYKPKKEEDKWWKTKWWEDLPEK